MRYTYYKIRICIAIYIILYINQEKDMAERLVNWFGFSIGLTLLPVLLSLIFRFTFNLDINLGDYIAITIYGCNLSSYIYWRSYFIIKKESQAHISQSLVAFIFISLICMSA